MAKRRRSIIGRVISLVFFLLIIYILLSILDFIGVFVIGTYKSEEILGNSLYKRELKVNGKTDEQKITWRAYGDEIYFYRDGKEYSQGTIQNGVISIDVAGIYTGKIYKDGDSDRDPESKSFVDVLRTVLKPGTKLAGKVVDKIHELIED